MDSMSFRKILLFFAAVVLASAAPLRAQFAVYGTITGERLSGINCLDPQGRCAATGGEVKPFGGTFGAFYDFKTAGPVRLGVDARTSVMNSNKRADLYSSSAYGVRHYTALGGVRATFATPMKVLRPYAEVAGGFARSNLQVDAASNYDPTKAYRNFSQVEGLVGLDLALFPMLDIRAIEFGAGEMFGPSSHSVQSIGAGLVFHFPR